MWYVCDVLYICVCWFVVRGCGFSRRYIGVCYCDMFSIVNVYLDHLKFCDVFINSRRHVCRGECHVASNVCDEPTSSHVQPIGAHCCEVMYFGCFDFRGEPASRTVMMSSCVSLISSPSSSTLFLSPSMLTCSMMRPLSHYYCWICVPVWRL